MIPRRMNHGIQIDNFKSWGVYTYIDSQGKESESIEKLTYVLTSKI